MSVEEPDPVTEAGLNEDAAPEGTPPALNETTPLNPAIATTEVANVMFEPADTAVGDTDKIKS